MPQRSIGIFDSGVGGLTVFKEISRLLPQEDLVYLGDTARVPYGSKSPQTVARYAREAASFLVGHQVKMLVVACNTASAFALQGLEEQFNLPVIGVVHPGARRAVSVTSGGKVGVIGTEGTVRSEAYAHAIRSLAPEAQVVSTACPLFVPLAEEGWADHPIAEQVACEYLKPMQEKGIDTLVLGCTHYPLLKKTLHKVLGARVALVDSAEETAKAVAETLESQGLLNSQGAPSYHFYVTDEPARFKKVGGAFLGKLFNGVEQVELS